MEQVLSCDEFLDAVLSDFFLSPYLAPDNMLANIPPIKILVLVWILVKSNNVKYNVP